ncbi:MAG: DUF1570 domain-containing protein [Planctomycetota bacterium]|nr:DUF1570 domain-containing protein [Planctomycetota bacterium]
MSSIKPLQATGLSVILILLLLSFAAADQEKASPNLRIPADLPEQARELFVKAKALYLEARKEGGANKKLERAIRQLKAVRRKAADFHLPHYYLGIAYQVTRDFDDAEKSLWKAISLREGFYEAMAELGDTYFWKRDWKKSVQQFDNAIATNPKYDYAYQRRAWAHARLRDFDSAIEDVKKWGKLDPENKSPEQFLKILEKETDESGFADFSRIETEHYIVLANGGEEDGEMVAREAELIFRVYTASFGKLDKGADRFPIIYFKNKADYIAYGAPPRTGGYYSPFIRKLVLFDTGNQERNLTTLYHEAFHQYLHYYLERAPQWFNEGHGDFFGACRKKQGAKEFEIKPNLGRLRWIQSGLGEGKYQPLPRLMTMTRGELYDPKTVSMNYAQSWSFVYFLRQYQEGKYRPLLKKYYGQLQAGRGRRDAYNRTFGKLNMKRMEEQWKGFIRGLGGR